MSSPCGFSGAAARPKSPPMNVGPRSESAVLPQLLLVTSVLRFYRLALPPAQVVMIGDRASDVEAAQAVGCRFVGCDYSHGHGAEIAAAGPLVERFADLPATIAALA